MVNRLGAICLYQGDDWAGLVSVFNCDGTPTDLTGYNVHAQIRTGPSNQQRRIAACFTTAIILPNQISISLTHRQTTCLRQLNYVWDLEIVSSDGVITTIVAGPVSVTPQVTREPRLWREDEIAAWRAAWGLTTSAPAPHEQPGWLFQPV